jgi:hypothetical protein
VYGKAKPRLVRIVYTVEEDISKPGTFLLSRQELPAIPTKNSRKTDVKSSSIIHEVIDGIVALSLNYKIVIRKTIEDEKVQSPPEKREVKQFAEWNSDKQLKDNKRLLPDLITITLHLVDSQDQERDFTFVIPVLSKPQKKEKSKKTPPKTANKLVRIQMPQRKRNA